MDGNIDGPRGYAKWDRSDGERQITCAFTYMCNQKQMNKHETHKQQTSGCQRGEREDRQNRWKGLRGTNFQMY